MGRIWEEGSAYHGRCKQAAPTTLCRGLLVFSAYAIILFCSSISLRVLIVASESDILPFHAPSSPCHNEWTQASKISWHALSIKAKVTNLLDGVVVSQHSSYASTGRWLSRPYSQAKKHRTPLVMQPSGRDVLDLMS